MNGVREIINLGYISPSVAAGILNGRIGIMVFIGKYGYWAMEDTLPERYRATG